MKSMNWIYQNKDGTDVSPSDFPKGSRLKAEHRLDVIREPLSPVTPAHTHRLNKHQEKDGYARAVDIQ